MKASTAEKEERSGASGANALKVLFWVSPVTEMAWPWQKLWWMKAFVPRMQASLDKAGYRVESTCIVSSDLAEAMSLQGVEADGRVVALTQKELLDGYRFDALAETVRYQETRESSDFFAHLGGLVREKLGPSYEPDVIISFAPSPFFAELYPNAVLLYHEYGVFSRSPYPETYYFDPYGTTSRNFVSIFADRINAERPESDGFLEALGEFRRVVVESLRSNEVVGRYFSELRKLYRRLLLVPLGYEGFADGRINFPYQTQLEMVEHILDSVDGGTAVLLTQHPTRRALSDDAIDALKALHPNLLNEAFYSKVENFSQAAMAYCDACVTQSSTVAYQAAFLGKYLVTIGGFCAGIADGRSVADLARIFDAPPVDRDNFFVWVIRHHITDVEDMPRHLRCLVDAWRGKPQKEISVESWSNGLTLDEFRAKLRKWSAAARPPVLYPQGCCTFFFDQGAGFSEGNAIRVLRTRQDLFDETIPLPHGCRRLRLDPVEGGAVLCEELAFSVNGKDLPVAETNGAHTDEGWLSLSQDPQFVCQIPDGVGSVRVRAKFRVLPEAEALARCERERRAMQEAAAQKDRAVADLSAERERIAAELAAARAEAMSWKSSCEGMSGSACWRMTKPVRWALDGVKALVGRKRQ